MHTKVLIESSFLPTHMTRTDNFTAKSNRPFLLYWVWKLCYTDLYNQEMVGGSIQIAYLTYGILNFVVKNAYFLTVPNKCEPFGYRPCFRKNMYSSWCTWIWSTLDTISTFSYWQKITLRKIRDLARITVTASSKRRWRLHLAFSPVH
jgi:hypothetical protein